MILCDTNIFIHAFNGNPATISALTQIGTAEMVLSAITVMELLQGQKAVELIDLFKLSHGLQIPDAIIGATALIHQLPLFTYNIRDFNFIPAIILYEV
jgi:predicted nucleic acid-binding protein